MAGGPPVTLAHVDPASGRAHRLDEHLRAVGALAQGFAQAFAAGPWGFVAGLVHDLGGSSHKCMHDLARSRSSTPWEEAADALVAGTQR